MQTKLKNLFLKIKNNLIQKYSTQIVIEKNY